MTEAKKVGRPATGRTPVRTLRLGALWGEAKAIADRRGDKMTAIVEEALRRYVRQHQDDS